MAATGVTEIFKDSDSSFTSCTDVSCLILKQSAAINDIRKHYVIKQSFLVSYVSKDSSDWGLCKLIYTPLVMHSITDINILLANLYFEHFFCTCELFSHYSFFNFPSICWWEDYTEFNDLLQFIINLLKNLATIFDGMYCTNYYTLIRKTCHRL